MTTIEGLFIEVGYSFFAQRRLRTFLQYFQQDEYDEMRFLKWLKNKRAFDKRATLVVLACLLLSQVSSTRSDVIFCVSLLIGLLVTGARETDPTRFGKKVLVMTSRATRVLWLALAIIVALTLPIVILPAPKLAWIVAAQIVPLALCVATVFLKPYETWNNRRFVREARDKLATVKPVSIGITGSFGKTSVKHILGHVLASYKPTLMTPGSVNTDLGISRVVRGQLTARERFFVCEMGAYKLGSIKRLCSLTSPDLGIITSIGHAHYERFRSLEVVASAKFELAEAVIARGGKIVAPENLLSVSTARAFVDRHRESFFMVGATPSSNLIVLESRQTFSGTSVTVEWAGQQHNLTAPLFGSHHELNISLAFAAALCLGLAPEDISLIIRTTPQIRHRSEIGTHPTGAILIDDAYNSNPSGFKGALELLDCLRKEPEGKRVLVTPGMAELGEAHDEEHAKIGKFAAQYVDVLLPIMPGRLTSLLQAYSAANPKGQIFPFENYGDANAWLTSNLKINDVVLLENDLPDLYERQLQL